MSPNPHHYTVVATVLILAVTLCLNATPFPEQEIITEGFSWGVVYACAVVYLRFFPDVSQLSRPRISHSVSSFALCASLLCLSRSVRVMSWSMVSIWFRFAGKFLARLLKSRLFDYSLDLYFSRLISVHHQLNYPGTVIEPYSIHNPKFLLSFYTSSETRGTTTSIFSKQCQQNTGSFLHRPSFRCCPGTDCR